MSLKDMLANITGGDLSKVGEIGQTLMTAFNENRADAAQIKARLDQLESHARDCNEVLGQLVDAVRAMDDRLAGRAQPAALPAPVEAPQPNGAVQQ